MASQRIIGALIGLSALTGVCMSNTLYANVFAKRPEVITFVEELEKTHKIDKKQAMQVLSKIESSPEIIQRMTTPYEALPWVKYKGLFLTDKKIKGGAEFWSKHATSLKQAEATYGVPASIIVAIIGVESSYGQTSGKYPVIQALATLAFDYPPRAEFFKQELREFLLLTAENKLDPLTIKGSYAGAMGMPQFISSSYRNYAVDFDKSGAIDLFTNTHQVIGSVANFFKSHGWQAGQAVAYKAKAQGEKYKTLALALNNDPRTTLTISSLKPLGITPTVKIKDPDTNVSLLVFDNGTNKEHWLGAQNFYVISRYNRSSNYAMAVYQLSLEIDEQHKK